MLCINTNFCNVIEPLERDLPRDSRDQRELCLSSTFDLATKVTGLVTTTVKLAGFHICHPKQEKPHIKSSK